MSVFGSRGGGDLLVDVGEIEIKWEMVMSFHGDLLGFNGISRGISRGFQSHGTPKSSKLWMTMTIETPKRNSIWLVVWIIFYFSIYWEESSQLTNSYFSEG